MLKIKWYKFLNNAIFSSEATQKWLGITVKILKVFAYMLTFLVVLGTEAEMRHSSEQLTTIVIING